MTVRSYNQFCSVARGMDVIGERWTMLILRDLLIGGPKRFTDLRAGLVGIAPNILSERLKTLVEAGVVRQRTLDPPAPATVYELTELGEGLRPVLHELLRWGIAFMDAPREGESFDLDWLVAALGVLAPPDAPEELAGAYEFRLPEGTLHFALGPDGNRMVAGPADEPSAVITTDLETFMAIGLHGLEFAEAMADGRLSVDGDADRLAGVAHLMRPAASAEY